MARSPKNKDSLDMNDLGAVTAAGMCADDIAALLSLADGPLSIRRIAKEIARSERYVKEVLAVNKSRFTQMARGIVLKGYNMSPSKVEKIKRMHGHTFSIEAIAKEANVSPVEVCKIVYKGRYVPPRYRKTKIANKLAEKWPLSGLSSAESDAVWELVDEGCDVHSIQKLFPLTELDALRVRLYAATKKVDK